MDVEADPDPAGAPAASDDALRPSGSAGSGPDLDAPYVDNSGLDGSDLDDSGLDDMDLPSPGLPVPRWLGVVFLLVAVLTLGWVVELWVTLPYRDVSAHYRLAWAGFDAMLACMLARTGWLAWRGYDHVELPAVSAATLLVVDMWFDVVTSSTPKDRWLAIASAVLVEIPLAALCLWIARNAERVRRERLTWALRVDPRSLRR